MPSQVDAVALVTGHSRGIGAALAEGLLGRGAQVVGVARGSNAHLRMHGRFREVRLDLSDSAALTRWLESDEVHRLFEAARMALLVNNAGLLQPIGPLQNQDVGAVARAVAVNVTAPLMLSAAFVAATATAAERRILHISSGAGRKAYAGWSVYCATKAALDHHARAVRLDRTPRLRIASLAPGVIDTDMQAEIRATTADRFPDRQRFVDLKREGKLPSPADRATEAVDFLLSEGFGRDATAELTRR